MEMSLKTCQEGIQSYKQKSNHFVPFSLKFHKII